MASREVCGVTNCRQAASLHLEGKPFCAPHFISAGYERMDEYSDVIADHRFEEAAAEQMWQFLVECIEGAADLTQHAENLDNLQRARLFDILLCASDLSRRLRRSARREASISVSVRSEKLGRAWEEDARTKVVSRHGALLEIEHPAEPGDTLTIARPDTGAETKARVAWRRSQKGGHYEVGVEFLGCDNFWELQWDGAEHLTGNWSTGPRA